MPLVHVVGSRDTELVVRAIAGTLAAANERVLAVDLAPFAGGLDVVFGIEHLPGWRWGDVAEAVGDLDVDLLERRLPHCGDIAVLAHGRVVDEVPLAVVTSLLAISDDRWIITDVRDPLLVRQLHPPARVICAGGCAPREVAAVAAIHAALGGAEVVLYDAADDVVPLVEDALDQPVMVIGRDRRAQRALMIGAPPPSRGPLARWAHDEFAEVAR